MACNIQISSIMGVAPDLSGNPTSIRIQGTLTSGGCVQVRAKLVLPDALSGVSPVENGAFEVELLLGTHYQPGDILCGQTHEVTLRVECLDGDSCQVEERITDLPCAEHDPCDLAFASSGAVVGVANENEPLAPATLTISGTSSACTAVEVRFTYTIGTIATTTDWKSAPVTNGAWSATFLRFADYLKDVQCGDSIAVTARCANLNDCVIESAFDIDCAEVVTCPDAALTAVVEDQCVQGRRKVTFTVTLSDVTADTSISGSIKTGDLSIVNEIELPVEYSAASANTWQAGSGTASKTFTHYYLAGSYTNVRLVLVGECAGETPLTNAAGGTISLPPIAACECPEATLDIRVCRVTDPALHCGDPIPGVNCHRLTDEELAAPTGLRAGIYLVRAVTDPPNTATGYSWTVNGTLQQGESDNVLCVALNADEVLDVNVAALLSPSCAVSGDVTLRGERVEQNDPRPSPPPPNDDDETPPEDDDETPPNDGPANPPPPPTPSLSACTIGLFTAFILAIAAGIAIFVTACFLWADPTTTAFWVGVVVSVVLVILSIIAFILWAIFCGKLRRQLCGTLVWIHDIFILLSALSGILALIQALQLQLPCALGLLIDCTYFGVMAALTEAIIRILGCPLGQNGAIGWLIGFFNGLGSLGSGENQN